MKKPKRVKRITDKERLDFIFNAKHIRDLRCMNQTAGGTIFCDAENVLSGYHKNPRKAIDAAIKTQSEGGDGLRNR